MKGALLLNANRPCTARFTGKTYFKINTNVGNTYISQCVERIFEADTDTLLGLQKRFADWALRGDDV